MKRLFRLAAVPLLAAALCFTGLAHAVAAEAIQSFVSDVHLAKNGELTVSETIRVNAEGREIRHGIYRDFPLFFQDAKGGVHEVTFNLLGVMRDGKPEPYFTKRINNAIRIYAGSKDTYVSHGEHTYVFRYRTGRQVRWFNGKAELNWNVTGNFWRFPILSATYHLHLINNLRPERFIAFTGRMGTRGHDWQGGLADNGVLTIQTTKRLGPGEGLTVVAALPAAAVSPPSQSQRLWWSLLDNRRWIFGGLGFVLIFSYYFFAWRAVGRDPKPGTVIPLFHPPKGVSPALANYIHRWGFGREKWRAFTAAALSLAVRGLIRFDDSDGKTLTLEVLKKEPNGDMAALPPGERTILDWVNEQGGTGKINRANGKSVATVGSDFTSSIESENRHRFFGRNFGYVIVGLILTALVVVGTVVFGGLRDVDYLILFGLVFVGMMVGAFALPLLTAIVGAHGFRRVVSVFMTLIVLSIFFSIGANFVVFFFPHGFGGTLSALWAFFESYPFSFVLVTSFAALNGLFFYLMRAPTTLGRPVMDQLEGFKLFLETAEKDFLNLQAPEITAERFEALLPYAVALDVEKPWAAAFAAALRRAHPEDADPMRHYHPAWYGGSSWSGSDFGSAVGATVAGATAALVSSIPVSSGSSGFSGGGGGGGGGGGW